MIQIKVNRLTNLADARYCSALETSVLTFSVERGSLAKIPFSMVEEIAGWLSGPFLVLDFGADEAGLADYLANAHADSPYLTQRLFTSETRPIIATSYARIEGKFDEVLFDLAGEWSNLIEWAPAPETSLTEIEATIGCCPNIYLDLDAFALENWPKLTTKPYGAAMRKCVEENLLDLDYDRFEATIAFLTA